MREAKLLAQLSNHSLKNVNVVAYEESFIDDNNLCLVMELCDHDLESEIKKRVLLRAPGETVPEHDYFITCKGLNLANPSTVA